MAVSFIGGENWRTRRKPTTCRKSLTNLMLYTSPWSRFEPTTSVVIGTDCIGCCKSNYHTITATTAPRMQVWMMYHSLQFVQNVNYFISVTKHIYHVFISIYLNNLILRIRLILFLFHFTATPILYLWQHFAHFLTFTSNALITII